MSEARNIGLQVKGPGRMCEDPNCPFHGSLRIRGKLLTGKVVGVAQGKFAVIERESYKYNKKYMRYLKRRSRIHAHLPPCLELVLGDIATLAECRPLAKTISFVVVQRSAANLPKAPA